MPKAVDFTSGDPMVTAGFQVGREDEGRERRNAGWQPDQEYGQFGHDSPQSRCWGVKRHTSSGCESEVADAAGRAGNIAFFAIPVPMSPVPSVHALVSPCCRADLTPAGICSACGDNYSAGPDGILSFVRDGNCTKLDDIDYDAVYSVGRQASLEMYRQCRRFLGDLLPGQVDTFLEFGAGTGLFTLGFLANTITRNAVITDVSAQMLSLCRARLEQENPDQRAAITYAMWDGELNCLRDDSVDLVAGFSVLHHVLDYKRLLATLWRGIRPGGRAIFLEPNINFHRALIDFMTDVICNVQADEPAWTALDRQKVYNWIGENHTNLKYCGDSFVLQSREDKHLFDPDELSLSARRAGFSGTMTRAYGDRHEAFSAIDVYVRQLGLEQRARADLLKRCLRMMPGPFEHLASADRAPSFLLVLDKTDDQPGVALDRGAAALPCAMPDPDPHFRYQLSFVLGESPDPAIEARGWILGDVDIHFVCLDIQSTRLKFAVCGVRADVHGAINAGRHYPPLRSLFPGLVNVCEQTLAASSVGSTAVVVAVGSYGLEYVLGTIDLVPGTVTGLEAHNAAPLSISAAGAAHL